MAWILRDSMYAGLLTQSQFIPLQLNDDGPGLRLNVDHDLKLASMGQCLIFILG